MTELRLTAEVTGPSTTADRDRRAVARLLGRPPRGRFEVVVRDEAGEPAVIRNAPLLDDGTPMPTRWWLVSPRLRAAVGRLEATGGVRRAEAEVDGRDLAGAHRRYAVERDAALPEVHEGPRPSGGVGGTRTGVKCLHAHYAWHLAGGDDPVGRWVAQHLAEPGGLEPEGGSPAPSEVDARRHDDGHDGGHTGTGAAATADAPEGPG